MQKTTLPLFILHDDSLLRERLRKAVRMGFTCRSFSSWEDLGEALRESSTSVVAVVDPYAEGGQCGAPAPALEALLREFPSAIVIAAMEIHPDLCEDIRMLGQWGVSQLIALGQETTGLKLAARLLALRNRQLHRILEQALPPTVSGRARSMLDRASEVVMTGGNATDLAEVLHVSMRTLPRWCERAGLPPPRRLLAWLRILWAAELLDDPGRSVLNAAIVCGYYSDNTLRRALRDLLGMSPTLLRESGALDTVVQRFLGEIPLTSSEDSGLPEELAA